ncbi:hypothetical protein [Massilia sp. Root418]|jgi:hypothetical protein|uniref:hypothetical protein n=1 Tax=Massilia sp. Root418 TaxID=1736532 RepID=UPI0012F66BB6|nr:hypothetical protein [Massilia sp. Root418]
MNQTTLEEFYQRIGSEALSWAEDYSGKMLVYAELDDGFISASLLYENGTPGEATFKYCPSDLEEIISSFWETWNDVPGNKTWKVMVYLIDSDDFSIDLIYPDQINPDETATDRRTSIFKIHFPSSRIDYSDPELEDD